MTNDTLIFFRGRAADRPAAPTQVDQGWVSTDTGNAYIAQNTAGVLSWEAMGGGVGGAGGGTLISDLLWFKTLTSAAGEFDTNNADDAARSGALDQGYLWLELRVSLRTTDAVTFNQAHLFFNNDLTDANYRRRGLTQSAGAGESDNSESFYAPGASSGAGDFGEGFGHIHNYASATKRKLFMGLSAQRQTSAGAMAGVWDTVNWENDDPITRIQLRPANYGSANFDTDSWLMVVGWKAA